MEPVQGGSNVGGRGGENAGSVAVNELFRMKNRDLSLDTTTSNRLLWSGFLESSARFPNRGAVEIAGHELSYQRLAQRAKRLAATIQEGAGQGAVPLTGIFAYRSETAYAGVLGALMAGHGYVPLNRTFPVDRTRSMLQRSMCRSLVVDQGSEPQLSAILPGIDEPLVVLLPDRSDVRDLAIKFPGHRILGADDFLAADDWHATDVSGNSIAYLLFTSGSTGQPKGVMISHSNVLHYVRYVTERYRFTSIDRFSQLFDLTFDLSAHDMFATWETGACVCCPSQRQSIKPGAFINEARLTAWFSVPSTAMFMRQAGRAQARFVSTPSAEPVLWGSIAG